jgi:ABC-2 type transport system ATP-binding protein
MMKRSRVIHIENLTKRYGDVTAINDLSFDVKAGVVTGFLGPNGSGKSTTMRVILGLDAPSKGTATINGKPYADLKSPLREVGALLDAKAVHPGRSARNHLLSLAASNKIKAARVDEVLEIVGLSGVAKKRAGDFSLGMGQRLGIAAAILGDPQILLFDEPVNGLDPEGIRWVRDLFRSLANEGRTVFVSSHLMSEMALTADHLVVIGRGHLITQGSVAELTANAKSTVYVRSTDPNRLADALRSKKFEVSANNEQSLSVIGPTSDEVGVLAHELGITILELTPERASLEEAFMELTADDVEYSGSSSTKEAVTT